MRMAPLQRKCAPVPKRGTPKSEPTPWRLLLWATFAGLLFGLVGFGEIGENALRTVGNSFHKHRASGDIVLVKIDDGSLRHVGRWPWPRRYHAQLTDELTKAGAKRIFFDGGFFGATDAVDDQEFAAALKHSGRVILATGTRAGTGEGAPPRSRRRHRPPASAGNTITRTPSLLSPIPGPAMDAQYRRFLHCSPGKQESRASSSSPTTRSTWRQSRPFRRWTFSTNTSTRASFGGKTW